MANAEIVAIGSELLLGQIVDTNSAWMAQRLTALGVNLYFKSVVGDNPARMKEVIARARGARRYRYHQRRHRADPGRSDPRDRRRSDRAQIGSRRRHAGTGRRPLSPARPADDAQQSAPVLYAGGSDPGEKSQRHGAVICRRRSARRGFLAARRAGGDEVAVRKRSRTLSQKEVQSRRGDSLSRAQDRRHRRERGGR